VAPAGSGSRLAVAVKASAGNEGQGTAGRGMAGDGSRRHSGLGASFDDLDLNGDGVLTRGELNAAALPMEGTPGTQAAGIHQEGRHHDQRRKPAGSSGEDPGISGSEVKEMANAARNRALEVPQKSQPPPLLVIALYGHLEVMVPQKSQPRRK
jgi:hypothetical protein